MELCRHQNALDRRASASGVNNVISKETCSREKPGRNIIRIAYEQPGPWPTTSLRSSNRHSVPWSMHVDRCA